MTKKEWVTRFAREYKKLAREIGDGPIYTLAECREEAESIIDMGFAWKGNSPEEHARFEVSFIDGAE
jgi:hypothetical protein